MWQATRVPVPRMPLLSLVSFLAFWLILPALGHPLPLLGKLIWLAY